MKIGVLGATSPVGVQVISMLQEQHIQVVALSRQPHSEQDGVQWINLSDVNDRAYLERNNITHWVVLSHIWVLTDFFDLLATVGARRIVCVSSTSRFTKNESESLYENTLVKRLTDGEEAVISWSEANSVQWTILRPTLIYGRSTDRNLSEIVRFIKRFGVFPLLGRAQGLRQPVYVDDVAGAVVKTLFSDASYNKSYNISGAEKLSYREMVFRVFKAMNRKPVVVSIPLWMFRALIKILHLLPRYRHWNDQMVVRMNQDMVFDNHDARRDFGYDPQSFVLKGRDVQVVLVK